MREGAQDARPRARPQRQSHQGLPHDEPQSVGAAASRRHVASGRSRRTRSSARPRATARTPRTSSSRTAITRTCRRSRSTGSAAIRSAASRSSGGARASAGASTSSSRRRSLGYGMNWPITYDDVAPWYSHVEKFIGVCGNADHLEAMPDGEFLPPFDFNCAEKHLQRQPAHAYGNRHVVQGRWAHLSQPKAIHLQQGRGTCQARNLCMRGCPFGGYFSSNASTLPWAAKTGNLTVRPDSVVHSIIYDEARRAKRPACASSTRTRTRCTEFHVAHRVHERVGAQHESHSPQLDVEPASRTDSATTAGCWASTSATTTIALGRAAGSTASRTSTSTAGIRPSASSSTSAISVSRTPMRISSAATRLSPAATASAASRRRWSASAAITRSALTQARAVGHLHVHAGRDDPEGDRTTSACTRRRRTSGGFRCS